MQVIKLLFIVIISHSSIWSMIRVPRVNSGQYLPKNLAQGSSEFNLQQLMPQANVNPELLKQVQADAMVQEQPMWINEKMMPMRRPVGSGAFSSTRQNFFRATPVRYLLPGQEKNRLWVQVNEEIEEYKKRYRYPIVSESDLLQAELWITQENINLLNEKPLMLSNKDKERQIEVLQEIKILCEIHGLNPEQITVRFLSEEGSKELDLSHADWSAAVVGHLMMINERILNKPIQYIKAVVEHEIGHIVSHDSAYFTIVTKQPNRAINIGEIDIRLLDLIEKRADIHSGIQSKNNVPVLLDAGIYHVRSKVTKIKKSLAAAGISWHDLSELRELDKQMEDVNISSDVRLEMFNQGIKKIASEQYNLKKLSFEQLQNIIKTCDAPTYLHDVLIYHSEQN